MSNRYPGPAHWTRRGLLGTSAAAAASVYGLSLGLGEAQTPSSFDGSSFKLQAPEPNPKRGGVLRYGVSERAGAFRRAPVRHRVQHGHAGLHV